MAFVRGEVVRHRRIAAFSLNSHGVDTLAPLASPPPPSSKLVPAPKRAQGPQSSGGRTSAELNTRLRLESGLNSEVLDCRKLSRFSQEFSIEAKQGLRAKIQYLCCPCRLVVLVLILSRASTASICAVPLPTLFRSPPSLTTSSASWPSASPTASLTLSWTSSSLPAVSSPASPPAPARYDR